MSLPTPPGRRRGLRPLAGALVGRYVPFRARQAFVWDVQSSWWSGIFAGLYQPFAPIIARDTLHASAFDIGLLMTLPFIGMFLAAPIAEFGVGRRPVPIVVWLNIASRLLVVPAALVPNATVFVTLIGLHYTIGALTLPAYATIVQQVYPAGQRAVLVAMTRAVALAGVVVGAMAGGYLIELVGFRWVFAGSVVIGLWATVLFSRIRVRVPEPSTVPARRGLGYAEMVRILRSDAVFRTFSIAFMIFGFANIASEPLKPLFQVDVLRITPLWVGILSASSNGVCGLAYYAWGRYIDFRGPYRAAVISFILMALAILVYSGTTRVELLLLSGVLWGLSIPAIELGWINAAADRGGAEGMSRYTALHFTLVGVRGLTANFAGVSLYGVGMGIGLGADVSLRILFAVLAVGCLIGTGVMAVAAKRRDWRHETPPDQ